MSNWWTLASGSDDSAPVEAREVEVGRNVLMLL